MIRTNCLIESLMPLVMTNPLFFLAGFFWLLKGRAYLKQQIARRVTLDISVLPNNLEILGVLQGQYNSARRLILATGADEQIAQQGC